MGPKFTWSNGEEDGDFTKERLDRALDNNEWCGYFLKVEVNILVARSSDHALVMVNFDRSSAERRPSKFGFKFEAKWLEDEEYHQVL
jgi:hypothetical protein